MRTHLAGVFDGTQIRLYINGTEQATELIQGFHRRSELPFLIGADASEIEIAQYFFRGTIDEVRISRVTRYTVDFVPQNRFDADKDTIAAYHFDEGDGDILSGPFRQPP